MMKIKLLLPVAVAGALLAACGSDNSGPTAGPASPAPPPVSGPAPAAPASPTAGATIAVKAASSPLGQILVDPDGRTLYAFTNDISARSTCTGTCAEAWPPAVVAPTWTVAPGLDSGVFSTVTRDDGSLQLTAGKFPLYYFSGDARPGDVNGQGSGDVWFAVDAKAQLVKAASGAAPTTAAPAAPAAPAPAAPIAKTTTSPLGMIVVDAEGRTLYGFTKDSSGTSTCNDACAKAWPPVIVSGDIAVEGLDQSLFTTVDRADGTKQLKMGKWPLYHFAGDAVPGDTNGQGSGGSWFVIATDGKLIK
jgi:predicted lipoprotein with Yx(FWY)xxD motif